MAGRRDDTVLCDALILHAVLQHSVLRDADLSDAHLFCAGLHRADVHGTDVHGARSVRPFGTYSADGTGGTYVRRGPHLCAGRHVLSDCIPDDSYRRRHFGVSDKLWSDHR